MELDHLLTHSSLTHSEVSSVVFPASVCLRVCICFIILGICETCHLLEFPLNVLTNPEHGKSSGRIATFSF